MNRGEFIAAVLSGAAARGLSITSGHGGRMTICFNQKSNKCLHTDHLGRLFDLGYANPERVRASLNSLVKQVAPGRSCTHRGLREIVAALHL